MYISLRIGSDPVTWFVSGTAVEDVARQITESSDALVFPVGGPLKGRLVLAPSTLSTAAVLGPPDPGWIPSGAVLPTATLYVPSPSGLDSDYPGYVLLDGTDLGGVESEITSAMTEGTKLSIGVRQGDTVGTLILNGGGVPFVVICPGANAADVAPA